jgi:antitoxin (DNA-binding transcriptional repressor) of toxin-antitoxin stability system
VSTRQVNMHEAKCRLSEPGELVWNGEKVVIAKAGKPYLDLLPHRTGRAKRKPGRLKGQITLAEDFSQTPAGVVAEFEGHE